MLTLAPSSEVDVREVGDQTSHQQRVVDATGPNTRPG